MKINSKEIFKFISFAFTLTGIALTLGTICGLVDTESISIKQSAINLIVAALLFQIAYILITVSKKETKRIIVTRENCYTQEEVDKLLLDIRKDFEREVRKIKRENISNASKNRR